MLFIEDLIKIREMEFDCTKAKAAMEGIARFAGERGLKQAGAMAQHAKAFIASLSDELERAEEVLEGVEAAEADRARYPLLYPSCNIHSGDCLCRFRETV